MFHHFGIRFSHIKSFAFFYTLKFWFGINYKVTLNAIISGAWRRRMSNDQYNESNIIFLSRFKFFKIY